MKYIDFLLPGIFVQSVAFRATQTAVGLSEDLERGVMDRFRSNADGALGGADWPHRGGPRAQRLDHRTDDGCRLRDRLPLPSGAGERACMRRRGQRVPARARLDLRLRGADGAGAEAAQSAGFVVIFPLVFASSVFVPVASMPDWLQAIATVSPVTLTANTARTYALDGGVPGSLAGAAAWIIGLLVAFIPLCVWRYRRMN
jgi:hypothetical protein